MGTLRVVVQTPALDDDPRLCEAVEDLTVEQFVAELGIEALAVSVLPRTARLDERGLGPHSGDPFSHRLGNELGTIVGTNMARHAAQDEEVRQDVNDIVDLSFRSMRIARHSRVNSSMTFSMRNFLPLWVRSSTKS